MSVVGGNLKLDGNLKLGGRLPLLGVSSSHFFSIFPAFGVYGHRDEGCWVIRV